ncbi:MAG: response regulator [Phascolarctobacterium sp.]
MDNKSSTKTIMWTILVLFCSFIFTQHIANYFITDRIDKEKQLVQHTAQTTALHFESKIEKYLTAADTMKHYLLYYGEDATYANFDSLAHAMLDKKGVIQCIELAKDGIIDKAYPHEKNEHVLGFNLLSAEKRRFEASLARKTGKYTIAGPFPLVQGGVGALLFDPIYVPVEQGGMRFWGFALIVIDWNAFVREVNLNYLNEAGYNYSIWHKDPYTGEKSVITCSENPVSAEALQVICPMPNDSWYVDIEVAGGWISPTTQDAYLALAVLLTLLITVGYWQFATGRRKEREYKQQLEAALSKANVANEAKTKFLFNMSHDIRTPMNAILGFTNIAQQSTDLTRIQDCLKKISLAGNLLLKLINEVLNISRIESGTLQPIYQEMDFYKFGAELEMLFKQSMSDKQLDYTIAYDVQDNIVEADAQHLQAICVNLIANAQKFTPAKGKIHVQISQLQPQEDKMLYRIQVSDTGIGMSKEFQKVQYQLFERERTSTATRTEGTGLGLAIVKRLVDMLDGTIECDSQVGRGTTYTLTFALKVLADRQMPKAEAKQSLTTADLVGKEVLVVEDNALNREIAQFVLEKAGLVVTTAEDGSQAVDKAKAKRYDLILMDIQMPVMNGYEATRAIRALPDQDLAQVPIIAMTANAFQEDKEKALNEGMDGHVAKPLNIDLLLTAMQEALSK